MHPVQQIGKPQGLDKVVVVDPPENGFADSVGPAFTAFQGRCRNALDAKRPENISGWLWKGH
jgi:hypothetical protein